MPVISTSLIRAWTVSAANPSGDGRVWRLGFFGPDTTGGSLPDGDFTLIISAGAAVNTLGQPLAVDAMTTFHRLFGDVDGDGVVGATDRAAFRAAFGSRLFDAVFPSVLDVNGDEVIDELDADALGRQPVVDAGADRTASEASPLTVVATIEDFGTGHTAAIDWGDGTVEAAVVTPTAPGLGSVAGTHAIWTSRVSSSLCGLCAISTEARGRGYRCASPSPLVRRWEGCSNCGKESSRIGAWNCSTGSRTRSGPG
jgi:hypothetical protein